MSDLVTGDAVVLELRVARLASRGLALLVDLAAYLAVYVAGAIALNTLLGELDMAAAAALNLLWVITVFIVWPVTFETLSRGRSLGKMALGLRVVRDDGGPVRFRQSLVRGLVGFFLDFLPTGGAVAIISSLASVQAKRLGDVAAGTLVVRERAKVDRGTAAAMPPGLAPWAATLELSRLPDDLALAARQYLARAGDFSPAASQSMAERLADAVRGHTAPAPPAGLPAWVYLSAVLAERTRRETARLGRLPTAHGTVPGGPYGPTPYAPLGGPPHPPPAPGGPAGNDPAPGAGPGGTGGSGFAAPG